MYKNIYYTLV